MKKIIKKIVNKIFESTNKRITDVEKNISVEMVDTKKCICQHTQLLSDRLDDITHQIERLEIKNDEMPLKINEFKFQEKFVGHYEYWRAKRIVAIVEYYGEKWFEGKKILELGSGYGDIGYVFHTLNADVTFAEGRRDNCNYIRNRYPWAKVYEMNCENEWPFPKDVHYDLILHMGLLYHLDNIWFCLDKCFECADNIVLETEVSDSNDENYCLKIDENANGWDQSLIGRGTRPSPNFIEKHISERGWKFDRVDDSRCNAHFHIYDWKITNSGEWRNGLRRFWFLSRADIQ